MGECHRTISARQHILPTRHDLNMSNNSRFRFPLHSIPIGGHRIYDPYSYEMAQAFLKSEVCNLLLQTLALTDLPT